MCSEQKWKDVLTFQVHVFSKHVLACLHIFIGRYLFVVGTRPLLKSHAAKSQKLAFLYFSFVKYLSYPKHFLYDDGER